MTMEKTRGEFSTLETRWRRLGWGDVSVQLASDTGAPYDRLDFERWCSKAQAPMVGHDLVTIAVQDGAHLSVEVSKKDGAAWFRLSVICREVEAVPVAVDAETTAPMAVRA